MKDVRSNNEKFGLPDGIGLRPQQSQVQRILDDWVDRTRQLPLVELSSAMGVSAAFIEALRSGLRPFPFNPHRLAAFRDFAELPAPARPDNRTIEEILPNAARLCIDPRAVNAMRGVRPL